VLKSLNSFGKFILAPLVLQGNI